MEAAEFPENSVYLQQTARLYISEDSNIFLFKNDKYLFFCTLLNEITKLWQSGFPNYSYSCVLVLGVVEISVLTLTSAKL